MTREAASDAWSADDALLPLESSAASALESALGPEMSATVEERLVALVRLAVRHAVHKEGEVLHGKPAQGARDEEAAVRIAPP